MPLCRFKALLKQRADSAELTRARLDGALDRFERNELTILPPGSKLTLRNLALEAAVSKDTPLSRYPQITPTQETIDSILPRAFAS
jgi:hypothetical protein